jgi:large subunit ribosomal protein L25
MKVETREGTGKYVAFDLRKRGYIPGVVYGKGRENINVTVPLHDFEQLLHQGERLLDLEIGGETQSVIVKDVQHGVFDHEILHADFRMISATDELNVEIDISIDGQAIGVEHGGVLDQNLFAVEITCLPKDLPDHVVVNVSDLDVNDVLYVKDLPALPGVTYQTPEETAVVSVTAPAAEPEPEEAEEAPLEGEEGEAAEPEVIGEKEREEKEQEGGEES